MKKSDKFMGIRRRYWIAFGIPLNLFGAVFNFIWWWKAGQDANFLLSVAQTILLFLSTYALLDDIQSSSSSSHIRKS